MFESWASQRGVVSQSGSAFSKGGGERGYEEDRNVKGTVFINTKPHDPAGKAKDS